MKIRVAKRKWFMGTDMRSFEALARHVTSHYPKDSALHKAVRSCLKSSSDACARMEKAHRKSAKSRTMKRRTAPKRRTPRRRTAKRTMPKRTARRRAPARRRRAA